MPQLRILGPQRLVLRAKGGVLGPQALVLAPKRLDQFANLGGKNHPHLDLHFHSASLQKSSRRPKLHAKCGKSDLPTLGGNQRLWRAIIGENGGGAGRFVGAFATGDRAEADKTAVARNPDWESGPRCIEVPFFVAPGNGEHA